MKIKRINLRTKTTTKLNHNVLTSNLLNQRINRTMTTTNQKINLLNPKINRTKTNQNNLLNKPSTLIPS